MNQKQIKIVNYFRGNEHVNQCLEGQSQETLSQLSDLFIEGHKARLDWYITGGGNNTVRCGRKNTDDLKAKNKLIRIIFAKKTSRVTWQTQAGRQEFDFPLSPDAMLNLKDYVVQLASEHKMNPPRDGFWAYHYSKLEIDKKFEEGIEASLKLSDWELADRVDEAPEYPTSKIILTVVFDRNPNIVAAALRRAAGKCECCKEVAPFLRRQNNEPYLEVHHKIPLAKGGKDKIENAIALCPNCHREQHFGASPRIL